MIEQSIIEYLEKQSKGVIKLSLTNARHIIEMVQGIGIVNSAFVKLYRRNHCTSTWENIRNIRTADDVIKKQIVIALETAPNMDFYMYECYNSAAEFEGRIYTHDQFLFD